MIGRGPVHDVFGERERDGAYAVALIHHGRGSTELLLKWEGRSRRYVWRTPAGASVESSPHVHKAIDRLRALYNTANPEGVSRVLPTLVELKTFPPTD